MRAAVTIALAAASLTLGACNRDNDPGEGTSVSMNVTEAGGAKAVAVASDGGTGAVSVNAPGFKLAVDGPRIRLDPKDVKVGGVELYPGSRVTRFDVAATESADGKDDARATVRFTAPADPATVGAWFADAFAKERAAVTREGTGLSVVASDGETVRLTLSRAADGKGTDGVMVARKGRKGAAADF